MTNDSNKLPLPNLTLELIGEAIWTLIEPKIDMKLAQFRDDLGTFDGDLDDKISEWMSDNFRLEDYSFDLDGMIDQQVQYLAEDGDLKEWLDQEHEKFEEKVLNVLRTNTIRIEI